MTNTVLPYAQMVMQYYGIPEAIGLHTNKSVKEEEAEVSKELAKPGEHGTWRA